MQQKRKQALFFLIPTFGVRYEDKYIQRKIPQNWFAGLKYRENQYAYLAFGPSGVMRSMVGSMYFQAVRLR